MDRIYKNGDYVAIHQDPVWRDQANFILMAHLGQKDGTDEWEQLWASKTIENRYLVCCIPFFVDDLALGDEIETNAAHVLTRVANPSGHYTFRVWFGDSDNPNVRDEVVSRIRELTCAMEWSSANLLAVDAANSHIAQDVADFLQERERIGDLVYETGKSGHPIANSADTTPK